MIVADPRNPRARMLEQVLTERLGDHVLPEDLVVTVGGDGWMLSNLHERGAGPTYLGVNAGRLGFLLNGVGDGDGEEMDRLVRCLKQETWQAFSFPLIKLVAAPSLDSPDPTQTLRTTAVNDVFVERSTGAMALLRLSVGGSVVVEQLACDGLIVATALGSTAYSFSAGGVPSHPRAAALHITPICAHRPRLSPFLLPPDQIVEIEVLRGDHRPVRAFADGIPQGRVQRVTVRPTEERVRLAFLPGHDFTATLISKILKV